MNTDSKTLLGQFLQRILGRAMKKDDVVYTTVENGGQHQSTVKLICKEGEEYVGELCTSEKEAQQAAAAEALKDFAAEIAALPPKEPKAKEPKVKTKANIAAPNNPKAAKEAKGPPGPNSKLELAMQLQAQFKKAMTKEDVVYETVKLDEGYQSSVKLVITGGQEFTGEVATGPKPAEASAAQQALMNSHMWSDGTPTVVPVPGGKKQKKAAQPNVAQKVGGPKKIPPIRPTMLAGAKRRLPGEKGPDTSDNPKSKLAFFLQGHLGRAMTKGDLVYVASQTVGGGYQATVELVCSENRQYAGEVCETSKQAEASAAEQALLSISVEMGQPAPTKKKLKAAAGGGQSQPGIKAQLQQRNGGWANATAGKGAQAWGKGQGKANSVPEGDRSLIAEETITGEIADWNEGGGFGWIKPYAVIEHPDAHKRGGKIYLHKKDSAPGSLLGTGSMVQFRVYSDNRGLGACEVQAF